MHLIPHWIPWSPASACSPAARPRPPPRKPSISGTNAPKPACSTSSDGVRSSRMSVDPAIADTNGQGVLHYSMVLEGGNDALKLAIDNALSITSDGLTIRLEGGVEPNKPVRYSYTRQARGSWSLNWLVPIGHEKPSNIKVFIHELNAGNQLSHMSPIYTIEMGDELLAKLARDATFFVRAHESNEMQPTLAISHAGVSVVMAKTQPRRKSAGANGPAARCCACSTRWTGHNYLAQQRCNLDDTWEGKIYRVLAGNPAKHDLDIKPTVISHRLHFLEGGSLAALTAHQACHLPLETFTRHRQPRGWEQLEQCGYPVQRLVAPLPGGATVVEPGRPSDPQRPGQPRQRRRPGRSDPRAAGAGPSGPDPGRRRERALRPAGHRQRRGRRGQRRRGEPDLPGRRR